jgi:hypothetical protein
VPVPLLDSVHRPGMGKGMGKGMFRIEADRTPSA